MQKRGEHCSFLQFLGRWGFQKYLRLLSYLRIVRPIREQRFVVDVNTSVNLEIPNLPLLIDFFANRKDVFPQFRISFLCPRFDLIFPVLPGDGIVECRKPSSVSALLLTGSS